MANYRKKASGSFLKRNAAYLIMIACVLLTALIIILAAKPPKAAGDINNPPDNIDKNPGPDNQPVVTDPEEFMLPVQGATIGYTYDVENTVKLSVPDKNNTYTWVLFRETEFIAPAGTPVVAVYDGVVKSVTYDLIDGTTIQIQHEDGLISTYKYLQKDALVRQGAAVSRGETIGYIGVSYNMQYYIGAHLCFGLMKDGVYINPAEYLEI